ncbi:MAG: nucleoside kinase [Clostridiales bacterium]|nr:nucleoside kinase [Clostridiales bacterium]
MIDLNSGLLQEKVKRGTTVLELISSLKLTPKYKIVAAKVNNRMAELTFPLTDDCRVDLIDLSDTDGNRIYQRSLSFVFIKAARDILGDCEVLIEHSLSKGIYCEIKYQSNIDEKDISAIKQRMQEIIDEDIPFKKEQISIEEAMRIFKEQGMESQVKILKFAQKDYVNIYSCGQLKNYFYGYMVPSTGYLNLFDLIPYKSGVILRFPQKEAPDRLPEYKEQKKLAMIFKESEDWGKLLGLAYVSDLNEKIETETYEDIIRIAEALHEKKIAAIADKINKENKRLILIAGPSSSGKTTFAQRLAVQMRVNGLDPIAFSTDDYFLERSQTPKDENGEYDFESLEALDLELFNKHLKDLLEGKEVDLPSFNFLKGEKEFGKRIIKVSHNQPIIIEGIHGLNDKLTEKISKNDKFKIYISALTQLNIDSHNRIPTTDSRLIRRLVRDNLFRGHSAKMTLKLWASVRKGEEKNIFPFQEEADMMFNSVLVYELAVLKKYAEPLLREIKEEDNEYMEAKRLLSLLSYFLSIDDECAILNNSIIKEFIGGSCFLK